MWKKLLFTTVTVAAFFAVVEILLLATGVRPVLYDEDPYVGFSSYVPLFTEQTGSGGEKIMVTATNKLQFFNLQEFPAKKPAGTYRIFCAGGSTTFGRPYDDMTSFCGWLRAMLPKADPSRKWELINVGGVSYASYRIAVLMEELIRYEPDLFIIYTGHNEFLERRTYSRVVGTPRAVRGLGAIMSRTRTYTAVKQAVDMLSGGSESSEDKRSYLPDEVETILESSLGPRDYRRDEQLRKQVFDHYHYNLVRMVDIAGSVGSKVILVTPASNLRDCSPFKSEHSDALTDAERKRWKVEFDHAGKAADAGTYEEALQAIDRAIAIDDRHAYGHYLRGRILWQLQRYREAKATFIRAMDEDVCPLRAPTQMLKIVAQVAEEHSVPLVDFVTLLEERSAHATPGAEQFLDHAHPTIEGNRQLALALLEVMSERSIAHPGDNWSDALIAQVTQEVEGRLDIEAHGIALRNLSRLYRWAGKFEEGRRLGLRAVQMVPSDAEAHFVLAANAMELHLTDEAIEHYHQALQIQPDYAKAYGGLGDAFLRLGEFDEAIRAYREASTLDPGNGHAQSNLGVAMAAKGWLTEAAGHLRRALQIKPGFAEAHNSLGTVLTEQGKFDEAVIHFHRALENRPEYAHARFNLASVLRSLGKLAEAESQFKQILRAEPDYVRAHCGLGLILQSQGRLDEAVDYYCRALDIDPTYAEAHSNLGDVLSGYGKSDEAISHYRRALQADPNYAHVHCNLGVALSGGGEFQEAIGHFREAIEIDPEYTEARNNLGSLLLAQGKLNEAIDQFRLALQTEAEYPERPENSGASRRSAVRIDEGVNRYSRALRTRPDYARVHHNLGRALTKAGDLTGALGHFREAGRLKPNWPVPLNDAAEILATHPDPNVRNESEAVRFAEHAAKLTNYQNASVLDTLAMAYARAGRFDEAVTTIQAAIGLASAPRADQLRKRLELYLQEKF